MIALAMLGAVLVALCAGVAAAAAERSLRLWGRQARWAWVVAVAASLALPAGAALLPHLATIRRALPPAPGPRALPPIVIRAEAGLGDALLAAAREAAAALARVDEELAVAWGVVSLLALLRLARGLVALRRARVAWVRAECDATPVLVAPDAGPLVVGVRRPSVVLPAWALALEPDRRAMILRHELEHARAHDPALLVAAAAAAALVPWNPAVWWQLRRLRLAVELDCDARVLRAHPDVTRYGLLLLDVARRVTPPGPALAAALVEPTTDLERRIATMRTKPSRHRVLLSAAFSLVGAAAASGAVVACRVSEVTPAATAPESTAGLRRSGARQDTVSVRRLPTVQAETEGAAPRPVDAADLPRNAPRTAGPTLVTGPYREFQVERQATPVAENRGPMYPAELREAKTEGEVVAMFVVNADGAVDLPTFKVIRATDPRFVAAVKASLAEARYNPALVGGRAVRQLVEQPFQFSLTKK